eukprot:scaffold422986_cov49-Attheya_sp.AAC.1
MSAILPCTPLKADRAQISRCVDAESRSVVETAIQLPTRRDPLEALPTSTSNRDGHNTDSSLSVVTKEVCDSGSESIDFGIVRNRWEEASKTGTPSSRESQSKGFGVVRKRWEEAANKSSTPIGPPSVGSGSFHNFESSSPSRNRLTPNSGAGPKGTLALKSKPGNSPPVQTINMNHYDEKIPQKLRYMPDDVNIRDTVPVTKSEDKRASHASCVVNPKGVLSQTHNASRSITHSDSLPTKVFFEVMKEYWEIEAKEKTPTGVSPRQSRHVMFLSSKVRVGADKLITIEDTDEKPCMTVPQLDEDSIANLSHLEGFKPSIRTDSEMSSKNAQTPQTSFFNGIEEENRAKETEPDSLSWEDVQTNKSTEVELCTESVSSEKVGSDTSSYSGVPELFASIHLALNASPLPDSNEVLAEGPIMARTSRRAIMLKKWHQSYWVQYGPSILIFRHEDHFHDWIKNPYHSHKQRDYLVKLRIDFSEGKEKKQGSRSITMTDIKDKLYERKSSEV